MTTVEVEGNRAMVEVALRQQGHGRGGCMDIGCMTVGSGAGEKRRQWEGEGGSVLVIEE